MTDRAPSPPDDDPLERLLRSDGPLPLPVGLTARILRGVPGAERLRVGRGLARLAAAAAVVAAVFLALTDAAPAFAQGVPIERVAAAIEDARAEAAPTVAIAERLPEAPAGVLPAAAGGLLLIAAGPVLARRWRRRAGSEAR